MHTTCDSVACARRSAAVKAVFALALTFSLVSGASIVYDVNGSGSWSDTTRWVGGVVPTKGETVEIPAGDVEVNDADVSTYVNVKIVLTDADSRLIIKTENLGTPVNGDWSWLSGTGTVVKACSRCWQMYRPCSDYHGDWDIQKGEVQLLYNYSNTMGPFGGTLANPPKGRIYVRDGAWLNVTQNGMKSYFTFGAKEIHLAGKYASDKGVVHFAQWAFAATNTFGNVILEDDIYMTNNGNSMIGFGGTGVDNPGRLDLNGHNIIMSVFDGRDTCLHFENLMVTNTSQTAASTINVGIASAGRDQRLNIHGNVSFSSNVVIKQINRGQIQIYDSPDNHTLPIAAQLSVEGSVSPIRYYHLADSETPDISRATWSGNVSVASSSVLKVLGLDAADCGAFFSGAVSGNGNIVIDKDSGTGQLILGGPNPDFGGKVTINGRDTFCSVKAMNPGFVGKASDVTVNGSVLAVAMKNWTLP